MGRQRSVGTQPKGPEAVPLSLPMPYEALNDSPNLVETEREDLEAAEAAIDSLRVAFWAAGKGLQLIRDARLYRAKYSTFDDYLEDRWQMTRQQASRLILAWPLAEKLASTGGRLNERQVRALLPVASAHGDDAAAVVYQAAHEAAVEVDGVTVTAEVLTGATRPLLQGEFDQAEAERQVRAYIAQLAAGGGTQDGPGKAQDADAPLTRWTAAAEQLRKKVRETLNPDTLRAVAEARPDEVRELVAELAELVAAAQETTS